MATGPSEAETFWTEFLRSLADRGLQGVKLVIADDHKGLCAAARRVFNGVGVKRLIQWINRSRNHQRCRIHWMRNALARAPAKQRTAIAAMLKTIFAQETKTEAEQQWGIVTDTPRERQPKLGAQMESPRDDVLVYLSLPRDHWAQIASTSPLESVNLEIKRRADVIGIFPNAQSIIRRGDPIPTSPRVGAPTPFGGALAIPQGRCAQSVARKTHLFAPDSRGRTTS